MIVVNQNGGKAENNRLEATQITKNALESVYLPDYLILIAALEEADGDVAICWIYLVPNVEKLQCIWLKMQLQECR